MTAITEDEKIERILNNLLKVCGFSGSHSFGIEKILDCQLRKLSQIDDYREFMGVFLSNKGDSIGIPPPCECFPWIESIIKAHYLFLESLIAALRPTFPNTGKNTWNDIPPNCWRGRCYEDEILWSEVWMRENDIKPFDPCDLKACYDRVLYVVLPWIGRRLDDNRRVAEFLYRHNAAVRPWALSWIENFDFFLLDLWDALEMYQKAEAYRTKSAWQSWQSQFLQFRPWPEYFRPWPKPIEDHHAVWLKSRSQRAAKVQHDTSQGKNVNTMRK